MLHAHLRNKAHDKRAQSARARKYYNEYQVRARGKQLKRRTKEEMVSFYLGGFYYQMCLCYCPFTQTWFVFSKHFWQGASFRIAN